MGQSDPLKKYQHNLSLFVCLFAGIHRTLKIAARTLSDVVTRDRLCGRRTRRNSRSVSEVQSRACMLVCLDSIHTLEIIARILREVVNRERLCGTNALLSVASARLAAWGPLKKYQHNLTLFGCWILRWRCLVRLFDEIHHTLEIGARILSPV